MKRSHLMLPLALIGAVLIVIAVPATAAPGGSDPAPELDAPQTQETEETTPDMPAPPSITCPRCGADCPAPYGHFGRSGHRFDRRGPRHLHRAPAGFPGNRHMHGRGLRGALPAERLTRHADDLELTEEQFDLLEKLAYDTRQKLIDLEADLEKSQLEMRRLKEQETENASDLKQQLRRVSDKKLAIQELRLENWIDSRKILTEDQKQKLDSYQSKRGPRI